jgi:hypothetical protein
LEIICVRNGGAAASIVKNKGGDEKMDQEELKMLEWTRSARAYQKAVNMVYDEAHSIQDVLDLDD